MGRDSSHRHPTPSRVRLRNAGQIVEVEGGHIVRSTGRKDRHSKVCTAKGPRDRRVRLAAHTAIQFYDVQDRLGYDRPSKAVDWLIKNAKSAIDELEQLPPWHPTANYAPNRSFEPEEEEPNLGISDVVSAPSSNFSPMGGSDTSNSFRNFEIPDLPSRNGANTQNDLRLSLHSFRDPISETNILSGIPLGFDGTTAAWAEQRHSPWNGGGGYLFNAPPQPTLQQLLGENHQFVSQRGTLQSSNTPSIRAWMDPSSSTADQYHQFPSSISGAGFSAGIGVFSGFQIPARIQGEEEEHGGYSDKPSSASSDSRH